jgi:hypothetical protein
VAQLETPAAPGQPGGEAAPMSLPVKPNYVKFTKQLDLGQYLTQQYHIRTANELSSCEV